VSAKVGEGKNVNIYPRLCKWISAAQPSHNKKSNVLYINTVISSGTLRISALLALHLSAAALKLYFHVKY
jgi:hypothetical protein